MMKELIAAAEAVIARWESPSWKDAQATGTYIHALRNAVEAVRAQAAASPAPEPVAWTTKLALECSVSTLAFEVCAGNIWGERGVPLYLASPDQSARNTLLEGLLRDIYAKWREDGLYRIGDDIERIRAALGEGI